MLVVASEAADNRGQADKGIMSLDILLLYCKLSQVNKIYITIHLNFTVLVCFTGVHTRVYLCGGLQEKIPQYPSVILRLND